MWIIFGGSSVLRAAELAKNFTKSKFHHRMKPFLPPDSSKKSPRSDSGPQSEVSSMAYAGIGLQFAAGIILFLFAGKWIDSRFGTAPIGVLLGVFVVAAASFYNVYRQLTAAQKKDDEIHHRIPR